MTSAGIISGDKQIAFKASRPETCPAPAPRHLGRQTTTAITTVMVATIKLVVSAW
jgi:hypothetical protein